MKHITKRFVKQNIIVILIGIVLQIIANIGTVAIPLSYQVLIDNIILNNNFNNLIYYALFILAVFIIYLLTDIISNKIFIKYNIELKKKLKKILMKNILNSEVSTISGSSKGEVITRLTQDIDTVINFFPEYFISLFIGISEYLIVIIVVFRKHIALGFISLAATPLFYLLTKKMSKNIGRTSISIRKSNEEFIDCVDESLDSRETIKLYDCFSYTNNRFVNSLVSYLEHCKQLQNITLISRKSIGGLSILFPLIVLIVGSYYISLGQISLGSLISILSSLNYILAPSTLLSNSVIAFKQVRVSYNRLLPYYENKEDIIIPVSINVGDEAYTSDNQSIISVKDLSFSYGQKNIFHNISFDINENEFISVVGDNGRGKTTLIRILAGLLEPSSGELHINGMLLNKENVNLVRSTISMVRQKEFMFSDTVYNNIALGKVSSTDTKTEEIIGQELLLQEAGRNGSRLSGGEQQKVAIARAIHKKDSIIFMIDEGSTNLDKYSREILFDVLMELKGKKTILIVDHYLSYISISDRVLFLQDDETVFLDTHETLYNTNRSYRNLNSNIEVV